MGNSRENGSEVMTYQYAPTMHNEWCYQCDLEKADWQTETREQVGDFRTAIFTQKLCLDCLQEKWQKVGMGSLWGMRYKKLHIGNIWNEKGDM